MDFKLRYLIEADGRKAINELQDVDRQLDKLGGSMRSTFGADAANLIGTTAVALTAVGAAAIGATRQLFELSKQAAEYGSTIFDASEKTGLHAETLSAMDFAAKQSGTSLESITGGIAKYSKAVSKASQDTDDATQFLKDFGVKPQEAINDLDGSLAKVFKRIIDAKPGVEQMTLAQKAFGKSGADLLPFIKSFNGDLSELTRRAKELGVTINDETAAAADAFGDQLDTLNAQFDAISRTIGTAFMPTFMDMAQATSEWAVRNKGEIESWAAASANAFSATGSLLGDFIEKVSDATTELLKFKAIQQLVDLRNYIATDLDPVGAAAKAAFFEAERLRQMRPDVGEPYLPGGKRGKDPGTGSSASPTGGTPKLGPGGQAMKKFFEEELGLVVTSFKRAAGAKVDGTDRISKHGSFEAADVRTRGRSIDEIFLSTVKAIEKGYRLVDERNKAGQPHQHYEANSQRGSAFLGAGAYGGQEQLDYLKSLDAARLGKGTGAGAFNEFQKKQNDETLASVKDGLDQELAQRAATDNIRRQQIEALASFEIITDRQANDELMKIDEEYLQFKLDKLHEEMAAAAGNAKEEARITQEIFLANQQVEETTARNKAKRRKDELDEFKKSMQIQSDAMVKANEQERERLDLIKQQNEERSKQLDTIFGPSGPNPDSAVPVPTGTFDLWSESWERFVGSIAAHVGTVRASVGGIANLMIDSIGNLSGAVESSIATWALYGDSIGDALKKALAAELAHIAGVATVNALFATALGFLRLAQHDFVAAGQAFVSAGLWAALAAGTGLAARALSGGSARGGSRGPQDQPGARSQNEDQNTPLSRSNGRTYDSGNRPFQNTMAEIGRHIVESREVMRQQTAATNTFNNRFNTASAGSVVERGANERPRAISNAVERQMDSDGRFASNIARKSGLGR